MTTTINMEQTIEQGPASKWNYAIPVTATVCWVGCEIAAATWLYYTVHDHTYPNNPINPNLVNAATVATKALAIMGASMIPISAGASLIKATYLSCCTKATHATGAVSSTFCGVMKDSFSLSKLKKPEGLFVNTLASPVAVMTISCLAAGG